MSLSAGQRSAALSTVKRFVAANLACIVLLCLSGCLATGEVAYQNQVTKLRDRFDAAAKKWDATLKEFAGQIQVFAPSAEAQNFSEKWNGLLDTYVPRLQECLNEFQQVQADILKLKPPGKYETAHSIYTSAMTSIVTSTVQFVSSFDMTRQFQYEDVEGASATISNAETFLHQGMDNLKKADEMLFGTNWGLIVGVILAVFAIVAGVIGFFVYLGRRKPRDQPDQLSSASAPAAGYAAAGYPPPGYPPPAGAYPPPPSNYRPPPEAYSAAPEDVHSVPPTPDYPASIPASSAPPGEWPGSSTQIVNCPRCGAHVPAMSTNCPSCGAPLLDEKG